MDAIKRQVRLAGALYALVAVIGPLSLVYIPGQVFSAGVAPAQRIRELAPLLRLGIGSELLYQTVEVFLVLTLYALFKPVNAGLARQMAVLGLLPLPIVLINLTHEIAALMLAQGPIAAEALSRRAADSLATDFFLLHGVGLKVAGLFWGLWLFPFGRLVIRSGFVPRFVGVLAMIAGTGYVAGTVVSLCLPQFESSAGAAALILQVAELPIIFWLLFVGPRGSGPIAHFIGPAPQMPPA